MTPGYRAGIDESGLSDICPEINLGDIRNMSLCDWEILPEHEPV